MRVSLGFREEWSGLQLRIGFIIKGSMVDITYLHGHGLVLQADKSPTRI